MAIAYNSKLITNGLILCLDSANTKSKSYNLLNNPENLAGLLTLRSGASITSNDGIAPDGTQTADLITSTSGSFGYYFPAWPTGNATHSYFLKPAGSSTAFTFSHVGTGMGGVFNFSTKTFSSMNTYTGSYTELSNGWFLVNFHTTSETNNYYVEISFNNNNGGYIWGTQLTPFSYYKPYIPVSSNLISINSTNNFIDLVGGNIGTLTNGPTFSGDSGGSIVFDGTNDWASFGTNSLYNVGTGDFSVFCWIKSNNKADYQTIFSLDNSATGNGILFYTNITNGVLRTWIGGSVYNGSIDICDNLWKYVGVTRSSGTVTHYINSVSNGSYTASGSVTANQNLRLGSYNGSGYLFNGSISNVVMFNRALSADEISQNFAATRSRYGI